MKNVLIFILIFIGACLLLALINYVIVAGNKDAPKYVDTYISNSNVIETTLPTEEDGLIVETKSFAKYITRYRNNSGFRFIYKHIFFDENHQKYFALIGFTDMDSDNGIDREIMRGIEIKHNSVTIKALINNLQMNNPKYGSKDNPIPIFCIELINIVENEDYDYEEDMNGIRRKRMDIEETKGLFNVDDKIRRVFIENYLRYFMPRKEFNKMVKNK